MYNDYYAPSGYYEKPDYEIAEGFYTEAISYNQLKYIREYFDGLIGQLYGCASIDEDEMTRDIEELCSALGVTFPAKQLRIARV